MLVTGDELERQRVKALIDYLDTPLAQSGNVKVVYLEYAVAKDLAGVLTTSHELLDQCISEPWDVDCGPFVKTLLIPRCCAVGMGLLLAPSLSPRLSVCMRPGHGVAPESKSPANLP